MSAWRALAALATVLAAGPARAFVRTQDKGTGQELSWPVPVVPWHLNRDWTGQSPTCATTAAGDPGLEAARASFAQWEQSCADLKLPYGGTLDEIRTSLGGTPENMVVLRKGWCSKNPQAVADPCFTDPAGDCGSIYDCFDDSGKCVVGEPSCPAWSIIALTSVVYDPETGRIMNADVELIGPDGADGGGPLVKPPPHGWYFTCVDPAAVASTACTSYGEGGCVYMDLQNVLTHEAGHFLGLAHTPVPAATMFATADPGETLKRSLSADDVAGVCAIYPQPSGGCGCGSGGPAGALAVALAALALRRRRLT